MVKLTLTKFLASAVLFSTATLGFESQMPLSPSFPDNLHEQWDDSCSVSKSTKNQVHEGETQFSTSPTADITASKIQPGINASNWEQWEFDAMSHSGLTEILVAMSRDASYRFLGQGNLRIEIYIMLADGSVIQELDHVDESYVVECPGFTAGIFNSSDRSYSFHVTRDNQFAKVSLDSWRVRGSFTMASSTPPHHADGSHWSEEVGNSYATEMAPGLHYSLPMGGAEVKVDAILSSGKHVAFTGRGGATRLWASKGWLGLSEKWTVVRAYAGPYSIAFWNVVSRLDAGVQYVSGHLFHHDRLLVGTNVGNSSGTKDHVIYQDLFDGEVHGSYQDKNTGHYLAFTSPSQDKTWAFNIHHMVRQYEMGAGSGFGMTGFADRVVGGEVGGPQYEGRGNGEQTYWPEHIEAWKIWLVWGIGVLGTGKTLVFKLVRYVL